MSHFSRHLSNTPHEILGRNRMHVAALLCPLPLLHYFIFLTSDDVKLLNHLLPVGQFSLHLILEVI